MGVSTVSGTPGRHRAHCAASSWACAISSLNAMCTATTRPPREPAKSSIPAVRVLIDTTGTTTTRTGGETTTGSSTAPARAGAAPAGPGAAPSRPSATPAGGSAGPVAASPLGGS